MTSWIVCTLPIKLVNTVVDHTSVGATILPALAFSPDHGCRRGYMKRAALDGVEREYEVYGNGEPVVLIHPGIFADWFEPLIREGALAGRHALLHYHRAGCAGSSHLTGPVSIADHATHSRLLSIATAALHAIYFCARTCRRSRLASANSYLFGSTVRCLLFKLPTAHLNRISHSVEWGGVMKLVGLLNVKYGVVGCLYAASLVAVGCADGRSVPTGPSANVWTSVAATATGDRQSSASSPIRRLFLTKTCDAAFPTTPICTVQASEAGPFPAGTQAYYTFAVLDVDKPALLSAGVVLTTPGGDTATGHCTLSFKTGLGTCTFARGTGTLAGLHANIDVSLASGVTIWDGTYHFAGRD
jgi:hypothetical protein